MPLGGQCYEEGPFFPATPRYAVQVGIAKNQDLLLKPDWTAITAVITGFLVLLIASVVLTVSSSYIKFQTFVWNMKCFAKRDTVNAKTGLLD